MDQLTVLSDAHNEVVHLLEGWGFELQIEVPFPPFAVDIYLPDIHAAVEVDGPHHSKKRDTKRDEYLLDEYRLPVFHVKARDVKNPKRWMLDFVAFNKEHMKTVEERWEAVKMGLPWL